MAEHTAATSLTAFARRAGLPAEATYADIDRWSSAQPEAFWSQLWDEAGVVGTKGMRVRAEADGASPATLFPDAKLNYAQNLLRRRDYDTALVFWGEDKHMRRMGRGDLYRRVARLALAIRNEGVAAGDAVAICMPNLPETIITVLAAASAGAVVTALPPEAGAQDAIDRFAPARPKLLFVADGYYHDGKTFDTLGKVAEMAAGLPSLKKVVLARYTRKEGHNLETIPNAVMLRTFVDPYRWQTEIEFAQLPFDHPLYLIASTAAGGALQPVVCSAGGALLQHLKSHRLHAQVVPGDKLLDLAACGSWMWSRLVSGLAADATVLLYDGSPRIGGGKILFDYAVAEGMTHLCVPAGFIGDCARAGLESGASHDLARLRVVLSSEGPWSSVETDYVRRCMKPDVQVITDCETGPEAYFQVA